MRILGIDHGEARVGVAASDELGMMAHPVETIHVKQTDPVARIAELAKDMKVEKIVVGLPLRISGERGTAAEKVEKFADQIRKSLSEEDIPIVMHDERLTTVEAQRQLHEAGRTVKNSRNVIDQAAAVVILQDYLDSQSGPQLLPDPDDPYGEEEDDFGQY